MLNGTQGTVLKYSEVLDRWKVSLDFDGSARALSSEKLIVIGDATLAQMGIEVVPAPEVVVAESIARGRALQSRFLEVLARVNRQAL